MLSMARLLIMIIVFGKCCALYAITVGTYNIPPFSMEADGEMIGMVTEMVQTLLSKADIKNNKTISYPLARGLAELRSGRIDMFYPYVGEQNSSQEKYFLIGPIAKYSVALFVRNKYTGSISLEAMQNLIVGAERGSIEDRLISKRNLHVDMASNGVSCLRMVLATRVSACAIGTLPGQYVAAINNLTPMLRFEETGAYADMYLALKANIKKELQERINDSYNLLLDENYFSKQQINYENKFSLFLKTLS